MDTCTGESGYSSVSVYWTTVLVSVYMHGNGIKLLTETCPTSQRSGSYKNIQDILSPLTLSVGDHVHGSTAEFTAQTSLSYLD